MSSCTRGEGRHCCGSRCVNKETALSSPKEGNVDITCVQKMPSLFSNKLLGGVFLNSFKILICNSTTKDVEEQKYSAQENLRTSKSRSLLCFLSCFMLLHLNHKISLEKHYIFGQWFHG